MLVFKSRLNVQVYKFRLSLKGLDFVIAFIKSKNYFLFLIYLEHIVFIVQNIIFEHLRDLLNFRYCFLLLCNLFLKSKVLF